MTSPRWLLLPLALAAGGTAPPSARVHTVEIREMAFHPGTLTVARGDTVRWINRDFVPHTATAEAKPAWDTGELGQGDSGQVVARVAGRQAYICTLHPTMRGVLVVEE